MLIRMTTSFRTRVAQLAVVVLALFAGSAVAATLTQPADRDAVALVIAGDAAERPDIIARAEAAAARTGAPLRIVRTSADQLGATHLFAARGYDAVVTVGADRRIAIAPVEKRFPETRFVESAPRDFERYL
jgi:hypothetical protein